MRYRKKHKPILMVFWGPINSINNKDSESKKIIIEISILEQS